MRILLIKSCFFNFVSILNVIQVYKILACTFKFTLILKLSAKTESKVMYCVFTQFLELTSHQCVDEQLLRSPAPLPTRVL